MLQAIIHYGLHFLFPGVIAFFVFKKHWKRAWLLMILTMLVDADHLLATPIFDATRCSIGFHPLHSYWAMVVYVGLLFVPILRVLAVGLLFHMVTDYLDCLWM